MSQYNISAASRGHYSESQQRDDGAANIVYPATSYVAMTADPRVSDSGQYIPSSSSSSNAGGNAQMMTSLSSSPLVQYSMASNGGSHLQQFGGVVSTNSDILRNAHMHVSTPERVHSPVGAQSYSMPNIAPHARVFTGSANFDDYSVLPSESAALPGGGNIGTTFMTSSPYVRAASAEPAACVAAAASRGSERTNSGELMMRRYQNGDYETTSMYDAAAADADEMDAFDDELPLAPPGGGGGERFQQSYRMLRRASSSLLM